MSKGTEVRKDETVESNVKVHLPLRTECIDLRPERKWRQIVRNLGCQVGI